jgi:hypothetical protein
MRTVDHSTHATADGGRLTTPELARAREHAAADLDTAIAALGVAHEEYQRTTQQLGDRVGADLTRRLEVPIILHLAKAGLSVLLDRKLQGPVAPLCDLVVDEHARLTLTDRADMEPA